MSLSTKSAVWEAVRAERIKEMGKRPVRVANCSGAVGDPPKNMLLQATLGDVDFITADYLAEMNLAEDAESFKAGTKPGWISEAWEGIQMSIEAIAERGTKIVINGGCLNPKGLADKTAALAKEKGLNLKISYVSGDNILPSLGPDVGSLKKLAAHLDSDNPEVKLPWNIMDPTKDKDLPLVSANAYLGARAIVQGLRLGADIIICGRVADASPVIGAAWYWFNWSDTDYDQLAGSLIAGHLIECSTYVTGGNFSGFTRYDQKNFLDCGFPIAEIDAKGECVITKHEGTGGMVTEETVTCQILYELQGNIYLNSDVKAYLHDMTIRQAGKDRVHVSGIRGAPPPATTKLAIFYKGGFQSQILFNATGYGTAEKFALFETQMRQNLKRSGADKALSFIEFQPVGIPAPNPRTQLSSTTYMRLFSEALTIQPLYAVLASIRDICLQHYSGMHISLDMRGAMPKSFLAYYPALYSQNNLEETITFIDNTTLEHTTPVNAGHPPKYENLERRENHPTTLSPTQLSSFGPTKSVRLGDIALARSGDKGSNLNCGIFVPSALFPWFRTYLSSEKIIELLDQEWSEKYHLERVEFEHVNAVHFVIYGILGRGVSSSSRLDNLGKGFADYFRDRLVDVPVGLMEGLHL